MVEVGMLSGRVRTGLCILVAAVWATSILMSWFNPEYKPDPTLNAMFASIIGFAITLGGKDKDDDRKKPSNNRGRRN